MGLLSWLASPDITWHATFSTFVGSSFHMCGLPWVYKNKTYKWTEAWKPVSLGPKRHVITLKATK